MQINIFYLSQQKRNACYTSQKQNGTIVIALFDIFLPCFLSISFANLISTGVYACSLTMTVENNECYLTSVHRGKHQDIEHQK